MAYRTTTSAVSHKAAVLHGLCGALLIALMMSPTPAIAEPPASPAATSTRAPDATPAVPATQTATGAPSATGAGDEPIDPQREALFREFVQWHAMHAIDNDTSSR